MKPTLNPIHFPLFVATMYTLALFGLVLNLMIFPIYFIDGLISNFIIFNLYFLALTVSFGILGNILKK